MAAAETLEQQEPRGVHKPTVEILSSRICNYIAQSSGPRLATDKHLATAGAWYSQKVIIAEPVMKTNTVLIKPTESDFINTVK